LEPDEALAELTKRYFSSHGPATVRDFVWWSGLTVAQARKGLDLLQSTLDHETIDGKDYWYAPITPHPMPDRAFLLPNYDEYTIAYKDRDAYFHPSDMPSVNFEENVPFEHAIVMEGRVIGMWRRTVKKDAVVVTPRFFADPSEAQARDLALAAERYSQFINLPVIVST
jgi:hypothetical protein